MSLFEKVAAVLSPSEALPGRADPIPTSEISFVDGRPLKGPYPEGLEVAQFAMGCFWGVERKFWRADGVWVTAVGYMGGVTPNPTYRETCSGRTGHTETVRVVFDPAKISYEALLKIFWEGHDPTQGMRQGNDVGSQYRSAIFTSSAAQEAAARASLEVYQTALTKAGRGRITTEIVSAGPFYFAEDYHQQYLAKNPDGYCGVDGTGVACPIGVGVKLDALDFDAACRALPGVSMVVQWGDDEVYKVGERIFAVTGPSGGISFKATDIAFEALIESGRARPAPYLARAKWVRFDDLSSLDPVEVTNWLVTAHALVAARLTRTRRRELGL